MFTSSVKFCIILAIVIIVVIVNLPHLPDGIGIVGNVILNVLAILSDGLIFFYYQTLPPIRKTVLVFLMQLFMIVNCSVLVHSMLIILPAEVFPNFVNKGFAVAPNLTCSLLASEPLLVLACYCLFVILCFKAFASLMPYHYLSMNHNRVWRISVAAIVLFWILEYTLILAFNRTLCTKFYVYYLYTFFGFMVEDETMKNKPSTLMVHLLLLLVPRLVSFIGKKWKSKVLRFKEVHNNQVGPKLKIESPQETTFVLVQNKYNKREEMTFNQNIEVSQVNDDSYVMPQTSRIKKIKDRQKDYNNRNEIYTGGTRHDVDDSIEVIDQNNILNLVPRRNIEMNNWNLESEQNKTIQIQTQKPTRKPKVLKTDSALLLITISLIIAIYTIFINDCNNGAIWIHTLIARLFFHTLPHYWVLRSDDRIDFICRRMYRVFDQHYTSNITTA